MNALRLKALRQLSRAMLRHTKEVGDLAVEVVQYLVLARLFRKKQFRGARKDFDV
jgi:hypothetical protein